jgi:hypothetical protein
MSREADPSGRAVCGCSLAEIVVSNLTGCMHVCRESCVFSGNGLCVKLITLPKKSYRL